MNNTALILIDIQNDYFPGGAFALEQPELATEKAVQLLRLFREQQCPIVHIQHENLKPELPFMLPGSKGQSIHPSVQPLINEKCFIKHYPNAFWNTELEQYLKDHSITCLVIAGMMTHMCVSSTIRSAMERGFEVTVIKDACATRALELDGIEISAETVHRTSLAELTMIAQVQSTDAFLTEILLPV